MLESLCKVETSTCQMSVMQLEVVVVVVVVVVAVFLFVNMRVLMLLLLLLHKATYACQASIINKAIIYFKNKIHHKHK